MRLTKPLAAAALLLVSNNNNNNNHGHGHDYNEIVKRLEQQCRRVITTAALITSLLLTSSVTPSEASAHTNTHTNSHSHTNSHTNSHSHTNNKYWESVGSGDEEEIEAANVKLLDYVVGTVNTMFFDITAGNNFTPNDFYDQFKDIKRRSASTLNTRDHTIQTIKQLVTSLPDGGYSTFLTREELEAEIKTTDEGFLGTGAFVKLQRPSQSIETTMNSNKQLQVGNKKQATAIKLTAAKAANLPTVYAVSPHSSAERAGILVNDKIAAIGDFSLEGYTSKSVSSLLQKFNKSTFGYTPPLTIAKPVTDVNNRNLVFGYKLAKVRLQTYSISRFSPYQPPLPESIQAPTKDIRQLAGGDEICNWQLLLNGDTIFEGSTNDSFYTGNRVGYIRLTRFSKAATKDLFSAIKSLEALGASSYIIDLRNCYGGVIQEAMLTAASLLRDPSSVICYTMNSRGGFTPHSVDEFVVDTRYPGYLLSKESTSVVMDELKRSNPSYFSGDGWVPPSSYASIREQGVNRGIKQPYNMIQNARRTGTMKNLVILQNEGTASSAEVFASSLHDNHRAMLIGAKSYGKGLIQHTFPMPDGSGLRLTVAEYLTASLKHVTNVGGANFGKNGEYIGGGIYPDVYCDSEGIPNNPGADICVGVALDVLSTIGDKYRFEGSM